MFLVVVFVTINLVACDDDDETTTPVEVEELSDETIELVNRYTMTQSVENEIYSCVNEAIAYMEQDSALADTSESGCGIVSVSPEDGTFPQTISINYSDECIGFSGQIRTGQITVVLTDSIRKPGAGYTASFEEFLVNSVAASGSITAENTGTADSTVFAEEAHIVFYYADSDSIEMTKSSTRYWLSGSSTYSVSDDAFEINEAAEFNSILLGYYTTETTTALHVSSTCQLADKGSLELLSSEQNEAITINFGDGDCDTQVYVSQGNVYEEVVDVSE
jgi:hypothetical protein